MTDLAADLVAHLAAECAPRWRHMPLDTTDGVRLAGHLLEPRDIPIGVVVLVHGFTATGEHPEVVAQAAVLVDRGYAVVTYDARGHGASGGLCTLGDDERHDVAVAVRVAQTLGPNVVVVGASMGAISALRYGATAGEADGISGVVAVSGPAQWRLPLTALGVLNAVMTRTRVGRRVAARRTGVRISPVFCWPEPPDVLIGQLAMPVAVIHGRLDRIIRPAAADLLYAAAAEPRRLDLVDRMGHAFHPEARGPICTAVEWTLDAARVGV